MTVMLTGTSPNAELYSRALSNAYRWYYRLIDPDWSIEQDPEIWIKKAWRDPVLAQAMQTRMHMVAGREWQIQPGRKNPSPDDTRAADVVADAFARIAKFSEARALLATSVLRGSAYAFTEGTRETVTLAGLRGNWWTPRKLRNISKQRFIYTPETITHEDGRQSIEVQTRFYPLMDPWPVVIPPEFAERLIKVIYLDEEDRLTGIGGRPLLESVYFMFWCKAEVMKSGLQTLEKWAGGMLIAKTDLNAQPGELGRDSDSVRNEMLEMLESMRGRHVGVIDKEDEIEHIDGGASNSVFLEFLQYMDDKIVGLILGSVLPFGQGGDGSGSYARAVEERAVSDLILDFDKQNISEAISDTVIRLFWKNNRPQLAAAGLADAAMPQFSILPERRDDFAANAQILSQAINSGMKIKTSEAFEKLGLTQPTQEEIDAGEVIEKEEPSPGGFPFRESPGAKFGAGRPRKFAEEKGHPQAWEMTLDEFQGIHDNLGDVDLYGVPKDGKPRISPGSRAIVNGEEAKVVQVRMGHPGTDQGLLVDYEAREVDYPNPQPGETDVVDAEEWHRGAVELAASEGQAIRPEVLAEYPDISPSKPSEKSAPRQEPEKEAGAEGGGISEALEEIVNESAEKFVYQTHWTPDFFKQWVINKAADAGIDKGEALAAATDKLKTSDMKKDQDTIANRLVPGSRKPRKGKKKRAEAPSGKRKRCPDGEHKDNEGSCRPVT